MNNNIYFIYLNIFLLVGVLVYDIYFKSIKSIHKVFLLSFILIQVILKNKEFFSNFYKSSIGPYSNVDLSNFENNNNELDYNIKYYSNDPCDMDDTKYKDSVSPIGWRKHNYKNKCGHKLVDDYNNDMYPPVSNKQNEKKRMFMFAYNKCAPECCPSQYSCDRGCICMTKEQRKLLSNKGNNI